MNGDKKPPVPARPPPRRNLPSPDSGVSSRASVTLTNTATKRALSPQRNLPAQPQERRSNKIGIQSNRNENEKQIDEEGSLPKNWHIAYTDEGVKYYFNEVSGKTSWDPPPGETTVTRTSLTEPKQQSITQQNIATSDSKNTASTANPSRLSMQVHSLRFLSKTHQLIDEIIDSEDNLCKSLHTIAQQLILPLKTDSLVNSEVNASFESFKKMEATHEELSMELSKRIRNRVDELKDDDICCQLANVFIEWSAKLQPLYKDYPLNKSRCHSAIFSFSASPNVTRQLEKNVEYKNMSLVDILCVPLVQMTKYPAIFHQLESLRPNIQDLKKATMKVDEVAKLASNTKRKLENTRRMPELATILHDFKDKLIIPERKLIREETLLKGTGNGSAKEKNERRFFLFSDIIIIAKISSSNKKESYHCDTVFQLNDLAASPSVKSEFGLLDLKTQHSFFYVCNSEEERDQWVKEIEYRINKALKKQLSYSRTSKDLKAMSSSVASPSSSFVNTINASSPSPSSESAGRIPDSALQQQVQTLQHKLEEESKIRKTLESDIVHLRVRIEQMEKKAKKDHGKFKEEITRLEGLIKEVKVQNKKLSKEEASGNSLLAGQSASQPSEISTLRKAFQFRKTKKIEPETITSYQQQQASATMESINQMSQRIENLLQQKDKVGSTPNLKAFEEELRLLSEKLGSLQRQKSGSELMMNTYLSSNNTAAVSTLKKEMEDQNVFIMLLEKQKVKLEAAIQELGGTNGNAVQSVNHTDSSDELPPNWETVYLDDGTKYYYNVISYESSWELPSVAQATHSEAPSSDTTQTRGRKLTATPPQPIFNDDNI